MMQPHTIERARALRHDLTRSEKVLWHQLRNRKLQGVKFRRQQPMGCYILDFYCAEKSLVVELDGGQHDLPEEREYDGRRTAFLEKEGLVVLRFWNSQVRENLPWVMVLIRRAAGVATDYDPETPQTPHPNPLPQGARGQT